jgi:hypothetical protein
VWKNVPHTLPTNKANNNNNNNNNNKAFIPKQVMVG